MAEKPLGMQIKSLRGDARREAIAKVVAEYESSGRSAVAFCSSAGIARVTLTRWRRELERGDRRGSAATRFVEVRPSRPARPACFDVKLAGGVLVRVPSGFDAAELGRLLSTLRATC